MLLQNENHTPVNYLADWPSRYYDIPTGKERSDCLLQAEEAGLFVPADAFRRKLCDKRFFSKNNTGTIDGFLYAWTMIKASAAAGVSFFQKKAKKRELESYMKDFCLLGYDPESDEEAAVLAEEWRDFARYYISSCAGSKAYCSTLFGFVPIKDATVAEKIAAEIALVTADYPAQFGLAEAFAPLRAAMEETYDAMIKTDKDG